MNNHQERAFLKVFSASFLTSVIQVITVTVANACLPFAKHYFKHDAYADSFNLQPPPWEANEEIEAQS